jgi:hypothetical protein
MSIKSEVPGFNHEYITPHQLFREQFNLNFKDYIDPVMSVYLGKPTLDPIKFDVWLHE